MSNVCLAFVFNYICKMKKYKYKRTYSEDWDFKSSDTKEFTHSYHSYPAMMIPQIARKLFNDYRPEGKFELVFDPYIGSGTTLVESKNIGVKSIGTDINPLARLISEAKITYFELEVLKIYFDKLKTEIKHYSSDENINVEHITNPYFWYSQETLNQLGFLTKKINDLPEDVRLFFLIALSECIRDVSYTRNGEFKRYRMEKEKMAKFNPDTFKLFIQKVNRNMKGLKEVNKNFEITPSIIESFNTVYDIPQYIIKAESVDMVVTSPPYGDSKTTVAYGQFSRWANEWFNFENAKNLDSLLMGGTKIKDFKLETNSISIELEAIKKLDKDRYREVLYFLDDYYNSIFNISKTIRKGGRVCFVVGNRTVKGIQIPLDYFTVETFEKNDFRHINTFVRSIPNKRMPNKTSPTNVKGANVSTMVSEYIVIMEKN
jgi:tRNA G10  N-methylase Trm11